MTTRREVLAGWMGAIGARGMGGAAGGASLALSAALAQKADAAQAGDAGEWRNRQSGIAYRRLGRTGYMISEVVMGGNHIKPDNYEHVLMAIDRGLNYLDTAPAYGNGLSEAGYAKVLKARPRDKFFLNSKVSLWDLNRAALYRDIYQSLSESERRQVDTAVRDRLESTGALRPDYMVNYFERQLGEIQDATRADVMAERYASKVDRKKQFKQIILDSVETSLKRLGTDYLDILMCPHGVSTAFEMRGHPEIFEAFELLKRDGKVRHFGISSHSAPSVAIETGIDMKVYSAAMVAFNVVNQGYVKPALQRARRENFGVVAMKVARAVHPGGYNQAAEPERVAKLHAAFPGELKVPHKAYLWALGDPNLTAVISEMQDAALVEDNLPLAAAKQG